MSPSRGFVLICAPGGRIVEVLHDDFDRARRSAHILDVVDVADQAKCALFIEAVGQAGTTFGWEMHMGGDPILFAGFVASGPWFIVASEEPDLMERLHQDLMAINNELTNGLRSAYKQRALEERRPEHVLDEFARLNNELSALHRDHAKRARELERVNQEYEVRQKEMADLDRRRQEFVQHLVHDLRNPLTGIKGGIYLALGGALGPIDARAREVLVMAREGCERITGMIDTILELGKAEAGQLDLTISALHVAEIVEAVFREVYNRATERGVVLRRDVDLGMYIRGDHAVVHRVLSNYVVNALKFCPSGSIIDVVARSDGQRIRVSVIDRGPGIPADVLGRLFTRYGQAARNAGSTGLGLVFCREMVQAMGGLVGVDSVEGHGATFWFELERVPSPEASS